MCTYLASPTLDGPVGRSHAGRSCLSIPFFFSWARQFAFISKFHRLPRAPLCPGCAPAAASRHAATHAAEPRTRTPFPHRSGVLCTLLQRLNDTVRYCQRTTIGCDAVAHPYGHVGAVRQLQWSCHVSGSGLSPKPGGVESAFAARASSGEGVLWAGGTPERSWLTRCMRASPGTLSAGAA